MTDLVLFGPPGAGKSSVAQILVERDGYVSLSTGNILREEMQAGTPLGLLIDPVKMASGQFSDDDLVNRIIADRIASTPPEQPLILDGHPRNLAQFEFFQATMLGHRRYVKVVALTAREEILLQRVLGRSLTEGRADDNEAVFRDRIALYHEKTRPVLQALSNHYPTFVFDTSPVPYGAVYQFIKHQVFI